MHSLTRQEKTRVTCKTDQSMLRATHLIPGELAQVTEAQQLPFLRQHLAVLIHCRLGTELLHQTSLLS